jgi:hypothetical protein
MEKLNEGLNIKIIDISKEDTPENTQTKISDCRNFGKVCAETYAGGIAGIADIEDTTAQDDLQGYMNFSSEGEMVMRLVIRDCLNTGTVSATKQYAGGIVGYAWGTKQEKYSAENFDYTNIVEFNINHADITGDLRSGGIVGSFGASNSRGIWLCQYNINLGNVTCNGTGTSESANCAGGIVGYAYSTGATACAYILNNLTIGNIENKGAEKGVAAYFLGYTNSINITKINGNVAIGNVSAATGNAIALGWNNNATAGFLECSGNLIPADCTLPHTYELGAKDKVYEVAASDMAKLVSGEYVYNLNQTAGKEVVYMTVNGTDFAPTLIADEEKVVVKNADGTFGNPVKEPETTEPAPETTEPPVSGETGDSFVVFAAIAAISVLGVAVVAKRREN